MSQNLLDALIVLDACASLLGWFVVGFIFAREEMNLRYERDWRAGKWVTMAGQEARSFAVGIATCFGPFAAIPYWHAKKNY